MENSIVIDIGNTKTALGWISQGQIKRTWKIKTHKDRMADEYRSLFCQLLESSCPDAHKWPWTVASVVPNITDQLKQIHDIDMLFIDSTCPLDFSIVIDTPSQLGADLIASAQGGLLLSEPALIIVDAGTATTVTMVNQQKEFIGGAIAPGMGISAQALSQQASALTTVEWVVPDSVFGKNTAQAIQNGLLRGHAGTIETLVSAMKQESAQADATVFITGGAMETLAPLMPTDYIYRPNLTLEGIMHIGQTLRS